MADTTTTKSSITSRPRSKSFSHGMFQRHHARTALQHTASCGTKNSEFTNPASKRMRIAFTDDALFTSSRSNMFRLLHASQQEDSSQDNSIMMAKKALRYRRLLEEAQAADTEDPAFEISDFHRVASCG